MLKGILYFKLENLTAQKLGPYFRSLGQQVFKSGMAYQGAAAHEDQCILNSKLNP